MRKYIPLFLLILIMLSGCSQELEMPMNINPNEYGTNPTNSTHYNTLSEQDGYFFFAPSRGIYRLKDGETKAQKVKLTPFMQPLISNIQVQGEFLYYVRESEFGGNEFGLWKTTIDGKKSKKILKDYVIENFQVFNGRIYFSCREFEQGDESKSPSGFFSCAVSGDDIQEISSRYSPYFYINEDEICWGEINETTQYTIIKSKTTHSQEIKQIYQGYYIGKWEPYKNGILIAESSSNSKKGLFYYDMEKKMRETILTSDADNFILIGDDIYFIMQDENYTCMGVGKCELSSKTVKLVYPEENLDSIYLINGKCYAMMYTYSKAWYISVEEQKVIFEAKI